LYCSMSDVIVGRTPRTLGRAYDDGVIVELVVWIVRNFDVCTIVFTDCLFYYPEIHLPILSIRFRRLHYQCITELQRQHQPLLDWTINILYDIPNAEDIPISAPSMTRN